MEKPAIDRSAKKVIRSASQILGWRLKPPFTLKSIIHHHYLSSALFPILAIDLVLLVLYFGVTGYLSNHNGAALRQIALTNLHGFMLQEAEYLNQRLSEISRTARILQDQQSRFFQMSPWQNLTLPNGEPRFAVHANGVFYKEEDNGGSSLYYAATTNIGEVERRKARATEWLDPMLKQVVESQPLVAQAYLNTFDNMNRLYPFLSDAPGMFGPELNVTSYNFYYLADAQHNPSRNPVWTTTYLDPAGKGWMVSCVVPIYSGNLLEGVTGLDVTIRDFVTHVLALPLPWSGSAFLLDEQGSILAMPPKVEVILGLKELKDHDYKQTVDRTMLRPASYNILKHADPMVQQQFHKLLGEGQEQGVLVSKGERYLMAHRKVPLTGWHLVTLVDESVLLASQDALASLMLRIGLWVGTAVVVFYGLFFIYLSRKSLRLAGVIAQPLLHLAQQAKQVEAQQSGVTLAPVGVMEVDSLSESFNRMVQTVQQRTEKLESTLIESQLHEEKAKLYASQVSTDSLTGFYTTSEIAVFAQREIARSRRYYQPFSLLLVKGVRSDLSQEPHAYGAMAWLKNLAEALDEQLREIDLVGHWGDRFLLVLLPSTELGQAAQLAKRLQDDLSQRMMEDQEAFQLNIVVGQLGDETELEPLLQKFLDGLASDANAPERRTVVLQMGRAVPLSTYLK
ncbi:diguanylate cyclase [Magnetococcus marinus MC-1]|uniref:Diguanylate cyclase n=1 Tax=Magnetococcus marinus (strain ATCC BAA-1437 / JCM 17883 / MC-1) TaxID=156889 RepID=A0LBX1_MAGMM|nr:diguanylate cyclase [Magnetococcus marinus]ABK45464.1 diguanylate cyclase [Magnetococcus marinus MC-1]